MTLLFAAAEPGSTSLLNEHQLLVFLVQLALLVGIARLLGDLPTSSASRRWWDSSWPEC